MNTYILHWLNGKIEEISGYTIKDAFSKSNYNPKIIASLDWWEIKK